MMKKLLALAVMASMGFSALAQTTHRPYKFEDTTWDIGGRSAITYNYVSNVPNNMSHSGLGLDFCIMEGQFHLSRGSVLSLGLLDLQIDFRYLQKGYVFHSIGGIVPALQDSRAKGYLTDFTFSFPFGYTQKFTSRLAASLFVAPGVGLVRYRSDYIDGDVHYKNSYYPIRNRAGFRLDLKAVLWFEDLGLVVRYQPVGLNTLRAPGESGSGNTTTFSIGIAFCY